MFASVIEAGKVGIPFFIPEDGIKTFEISDFIDKIDIQNSFNACSIDGKGHC